MVLVRHCAHGVEVHARDNCIASAAVHARNRSLRKGAARAQIISGTTLNEVILLPYTLFLRNKLVQIDDVHPRTPGKTV